MRKVVYTVLTGNYDPLRQPELVAEDWEYICFTDRDGQDGVWQLKRIALETPDPVRRARYVKLQPHTALSAYDYSLFMDANLCITGPELYEKADAAIAQGVLLAALPHPERDCVYDELRYCYLKDKIGTRAALRHHRLLEERRMPRHAGLYETNVLLRRHGDPAVVALDNAWWEAFNACCNRDQLSFTPVLSLAPFLLFGPRGNARNVPYVRYSLHPSRGERIPGRWNWPNLQYNLRLLWRKCVLRLCLR